MAWLTMHFTANLIGKDIFSQPAIFISSLSPGYIAGGSQCTLAYLQAVSALHQGHVTYFGPPWLHCSEGYEVELAERIEVGQRGLLTKAWHWLVGDAVDRVSPLVGRFLRLLKPKVPVVYFNGDASGAAVRMAQRHGLLSVFIPHNYAPEYVISEGTPLSLVERRRVKILSRVAVDGFGNASARICLTRQDRDHYLSACAGQVDPETCVAPCYFSYHSPSSDQMESAAITTVSPPMILFNTNLALRANVEGIRYFIENIWPYLRDVPGLRLVLAGRAPRGEVLDLVARYPSIDLVVRPEPAVMERLFQQATVCAAIAFDGSGIKLRVAEALRRGIPVLASEHCARGYEEVSASVLKVFHEAPEAIAGIRDLLKADRPTMAAACRAEHQHHFGFEAGLNRMRGLESILRVAR